MNPHASEIPADVLAAGLADLRAYRLPDPVAWWPPAPGWWVLGAVLTAAALAGLLWWLAARRRTAAARQAQRELAGLRRAFAAGQDPSAFLRGLSALLRRYALALWPRRQVAGLAGEDWLAFLDRHGGEGRFRTGPGQCLADAPYRPAADVSVVEVADVVEDWIHRNRERHA
jgi:hypothetical protein